MKKRNLFLAAMAIVLAGCSAQRANHDEPAAVYDEEECEMLPIAYQRVVEPGDVIPMDLNTERYADRTENDFKLVSANPISVFSVDVDKASFSNARRYLMDGMMPPSGVVRIEEFINYFNYDYPAPKAGDPVALGAEIGKCMWNQNHLLLKLGLKAKDIDTRKLPNSNFVFLCDVSGSMYEQNKLPLLVSSFKILLEGLRDGDRVAIVTYAGDDRVALESTPCNAEGKKKIVETLDGLTANGSTQGSKGIKTAYSLAQDNFIANGNNRVVLATDGDFNVGISSTPELRKLIEQERDKGIFLTVLGFGMGNLNDEMMSTIADAGNGNYYYIDNISEARKALGTELWGTLFTVAKDVKIMVDFNPNKVKAYRLIGYEKRLMSNEDFNNDKKDAGDMGAGHTVTALYEIVEAGSDEVFEGEPTQSEYVTTTPSGNDKDWLTVKFRYKNPSDSVSQLKELKVGDGCVKTSNSADFKLASIVAEFAQKLNGSKYCKVPYANISETLRPVPSDKNGYIDELKVMVRKAKDISGE